MKKIWEDILKYEYHANGNHKCFGLKIKQISIILYIFKYSFTLWILKSQEIYKSDIQDNSIKKL